MSRSLRQWLWILPLACLLAPTLASAQDTHTMEVSLLGGVGGSQDAEPGSGYGNPAFQLGFAMVTEPQTAIGVRVGRLDLSGEERFGSLTEAELDWAQVGGEYRFHEGYYVSGIYLGLGAYRLQGDRADGADDSETALGGELCLSGDFSLTRNLAVRVELGGHYVLFDEARIFATAQAGLNLRF